MPSPKRRLFLQRLRAKRAGKRRGLENATIDENGLIASMIRNQSALSRYRGRGERERNIKLIEFEHGIEFEKIISELAKKFPGQTINALDEGAGLSRLHEQLQDHGKQLGIRVSTVRTDIDPSTGIKHLVPPEHLLKTFGRGKFHLVCSTYGGATYTLVRQEKALANIIGVLKEGGVGLVTSQENDVFAGGRKITRMAVDKIKKRFPNVIIEYKEGIDLGGFPTSSLKIYKKH
jgi:hypothetical protein